MGDVVSIGTKTVVQAMEPTPLPPLPEPSGSGLMLDDDQVGEFIALVDDLNYADDRDSQRVAMDAVRQAVRAWPRG